MFYQRFLTPAKASYFLFGPRGTGKSTWLKVSYPDALWIDLLKPDVLRRFQARPERLEEVVKGSPLTTVIIDEIQKIPALLSVVHHLYYWRTPNGVEVDFILYGTSCFYAIEVKNAVILHPKDFNGLKNFCQDYPEAVPLLLYRGNERIKVHSILCVPVDDFLKHMDEFLSC